MQKTKPYLSKIRAKHPTIAYDSMAYASGSRNTNDETYTEYIQTVETIDLAIRTIANIISLADMRFYKVDAKGAKLPTKVKNIDLEFPNETDSSVDFLRKLAVNVFSQGNGLIVTEEGKRGKLPEKMLNLYVLDSAKVTAASDGKRLISEFVYASEGGTDVTFKAEDCIYINDSIDPSNLLYSLSRLQALNDVILMQAGIVASAKDMLTGGAKDASIISSDAPISERNMKKIKAEFNAFMQSATSSSLFMNTPLNVTKVGTTMSGSEMVALLVQLNKMMIEAFAIPPYLLGRYDTTGNTAGITYSNRIFFNLQLKPVLKNVEKQMTRFLREQLALKNIIMEFDYRDLDILKLSDEEQSAKILAQLKAGLISLNEARALTEYLPVDGDAANNVFMPAYLLSGSPVSYNNFDEDLAKLLGSSPVMPAGNAGGEDNTNIVTDSRGGPVE
jgi:HK97 family phage portal protein